MGRFSTEEIEEAFAEYRRRGEQGHDWVGWGELFTDDAHYEEHFLGEFHGREAITEWIVECMAQYPSMTLAIDWHVVEDDKVAFYIWNLLPDPEGGGKSFAFPNTTVIRYAGDGKWDWEADFYNPADAERVWTEWFTAGGRIDTPPDRSLGVVPDTTPPVPEPAHPREEILAEFEKYRERGALAVATGDWDQWADQFTEDADYYEHHYGRFSGQDAIREWITGVMKPFPEMVFPVSWTMVDGNRVIALIPNILPDPAGGDEYFGFDVFVILHYAGDGKWSYEEDVYNPAEAGRAVNRWVKAGGVMPS